MRNAATYDDDLAYGSPTRKGAPRKPAQGKTRAAGAGGKGRKGTSRLRFDVHKVARFAAIGMAATMATGIMVNALVLQKGHHPAPLFGRSAPAAVQAASKPTSTQANSTQLPPMPPARVQSDEAEMRPSAAKPRRAVVASRDLDEANSDDAIGRLLAGGTLPASGKAASAKASNDGKLDGKTVTGVQRALTKLGFKVPATGAAGPVTKKAIEAFEKDRHMPVKGELSHRLVKVLAAESGIKID